MNVHRVEFQKRAIDRELDLFQLVVDDRQWSYSAGNDSQVAHQAIGLAERQATGTEQLSERLQIDFPIFQAGYQPHRPLLVAEKEILGVATRQLTAQFLGLLDSEKWRMGNASVSDAHFVETLKELLRGEGRRAVLQPLFNFTDVMHGGGTIAIRAGTIKALATPGRKGYSPSAPSGGRLTRCGRSSGVEHNLAKVGVVSSNLIARSNSGFSIRVAFLAAFLFALPLRLGQLSHFPNCRA